MEKKTVSNRVSEFLSRRPISCLLFAILIILPSTAGLFKLESDFGIRIWFREGDSNLKDFDVFERLFGNDENIVVIVHSKNGIFTNSTVSQLHQLVGELEQVEDVIKVDSIATFQWVQGFKDEVSVEPLLPYPEDVGSSGWSDELLEERKSVALSHPVTPGYLISKDAKTAPLFLRLRPVFEGKLEYSRIVKDIKSITDKYSQENLEIQITGTGAFPAAFEEITFADLKLLVPLLFLAVTLLLVFIFRTAAGVTIPLVVILLTIISTLGIAGWLDIKFDPMTSAIPEVLIAICIADCIHILSTYYFGSSEHTDSQKALTWSLEKNFTPTFLTSFSTALGFFSIANSDIQPIRNLGILAGIGTLLAWFLSYFLITPGLFYFSRRHKTDLSVKQISSRAHFKNYVMKIEKFKIPIAVISGALSIFAVFLASQNEINSDVNSYFADDVPVKIANDFMTEKVGGSRGIEILVESGSENGVKDPVLLKKVETLTEWIKGRPHVTKVMSLVDIIKDVNKSLHDNQDEYYKIPSEKSAIAEELFLYTMSLPAGTDLNYWTTLKNDKMRINVLWSIETSQEMVHEIEKIENKAKELGLVAYATGKTKLLTALNKYIVSTFFSSMIVAVILISLLLMVVFKSFWLGLLAMVPNVIPPVFGGALMAVIGKHIDTGTVLVMAVCLGVAVDDTIHFLTDFHKNRVKGRSIRDSITNVFEHTSRALIFTTVVLVVGFGSFVFGHFIPSINFGVMTATVLTIALAADMILLPALLLLGERD